MLYAGYSVKLICSVFIHVGTCTGAKILRHATQVRRQVGWILRGECLYWYSYLPVTLLALSFDEVLSYRYILEVYDPDTIYMLNLDKHERSYKLN